MLELLAKCFPERIADWTPRLTEMVPTYGTKLGEDPERAYEVLSRTAAALHINQPHKLAAV